MASNEAAYTGKFKFDNFVVRSMEVTFLAKLLKWLFGVRAQKCKIIMVANINQLLVEHSFESALNILKLLSITIIMTNRLHQM